MFSNRVSDLTLEKIAPMVVDTIFTSNTFASVVLRKAKKFNSYKLKFPVKIAKSNTGGSFSGFDTFNRSAVNVTQSLEVDPKNYYQSVTLPLDEVSYNETEGEVVNLIKFQMQSAAEDMADDIGTLFYGDGTGNSGKDFMGLEGIVDDGTNVATYFGLSRATYPTLQSTVDSSSNILSLAKLGSLYDAISDGTQAPTHIFTTPAIFSLYEQLNQQNLKIQTAPMLYKDGLKGSNGFTALDYRGVPVLKDRHCPAGKLYMVNMDDINFYAGKFKGFTPISMDKKVIEGNDYSDFPFMGFGWSGWKESYNQAAIAGEFILSGQLFSKNPKRHGKLTGITAIA